MNLTIMSKNFATVALVDEYTSVIWTDRYCGYGDFELYSTCNEELLRNMAVGNFVRCQYSDSLMLISRHEITYDPETGYSVKITGKSLEKFLDRRSIYGQDTLDGNLQSELQRVVRNNITNSSLAGRSIPNFVMENSTDPLVTSKTVDGEVFFGTEIYEVVTRLCLMNGLGYTVRYYGNTYHLLLYAGADRSYGQSANDLVIFSPQMDNLLGSKYVHDTSDEKNFAYIFGDPGPHLWTSAWRTSVGTATGIDRKELMVDASDIFDDGIVLELVYKRWLRARGWYELGKREPVEAMEGELIESQFTYGSDFNLGDIVQVRDDFGHNTQARVTGVVFARDGGGMYTLPTYETIS